MSLNDNSMIDTELQVRLMNLVMGEASDFERDQLQLLMEQRAELASYYQHLQHMHGLLVDVGQGDVVSDANAAQTDDAWKLSVDKREKLLAVLDGKVTAEPVTVFACQRHQFETRSALVASMGNRSSRCRCECTAGVDADELLSNEAVCTRATRIPRGTNAEIAIEASNLRRECRVTTRGY